MLEMAILPCLVVAFALVSCATAHSYHLGSCPAVEPMPNFDMSKFLGQWYVIQKTSTGSTCLTNTYSINVNESGHYLIEQKSQHLILGLTSVDHIYRYTGDITIKDSRNPAAMTVRFPLSVAGSASYNVFMTDYDNYAGIFTCQKLTFAHRQSASILSRTRTLDKMYVDKIRNKLSSFGVDPYDLSIITQENCPTTDKDDLDININPDTFSPSNIAGVVRTAGGKIGDGVEVLAEGVTKVVNKVRSKDREELSEVQVDDSEWLP